MNLKNTFSKIIASTVVGYMLIGNFAIAGIELGKVIAEDIQTPSIKIEQELQKYVQYSKDGYQGALIQEKIRICEECNKETYKPIMNNQIEVEVPKINNYFPERVNIITANTSLTNGKEEGEINQNYDSNTGLLSVFYENKDENGNIYQEYKKNVKDEFEIIYIYPTESFVGNENEIKIQNKVKVVTEYKVNDDFISVEKSESFEYIKKDNVGEISNIQMVGVTPVYKGFMQSNISNNTKYETEYTVNSKLEILNSEIMDEMQINLLSSQLFGNENQVNVVKDGTIKYVSMNVSEKDFARLFGENGWVDFNIGTTRYATIRYLDPDENGNRMFATVYNSDLHNDDIAGRIIYPDNTNNIIVKTSKPISEGYMNINTIKRIKALNNYGIEINNINSIIERNEVKTFKNQIVEQDKKDEQGNLILNEDGSVQKENITNTNIVSQKSNISKVELKEPYTQMSLELSNNNFSTLASNKVTATIRLDDTNSSCKLFEEGQIILTLPNNLVSSRIINGQGLYTNGLKIINAKQENGNVVIYISGRQTKYNPQNISGGINIILDLELDIDDTVPSHEEEMKVIYNGKSVTTKINIVSKSGLLAYTKVSGYEKNKSMISIDDTEKVVDLDVGEEEKKIRIDANIINNYNSDLKNVSIVGKLPSEGNKDINGNDIGSNIDTRLLTKVNVNSNKAKVYYSESEDASSNSDTWTTTATKNSVAYKIELNNNEIDKATTLNFAYEFEIPANLTYNQTAVNTYSVQYSVEGDQREEVSKIILATTEVPEIITQIKPNIELDYVTGGQIVEYDITVENKSNYDVNNLTLQAVIPEEQIYTEYTNQAFGEYPQGGYLPNTEVKTKSYAVSLKAGEKISKKIFLKTKDFKDVTTINNVVNMINAEGSVIATSNYQTVAKPRQLIVENIYYTTNTDLTEDQEIMYDIYIENNSNQERKNIQIIDQLDEDLELEKVEDLSAEEDGTISYELKRNNQLVIQINKLSAGESMLIEVTTRTKNKTKFATKELGNKVRVSADGIYDHESEIVYYNIKGFLPVIEMNSKAETNIKEYEEINYTITVQNNSEAKKEIKIVDEIPNEIKPERYELCVYDQEGKKVDSQIATLINNKVQILQTIYANEKIVVNLYCTIDNIGEKETIEVTNKAILYYGGYDETDENYIEKTYIESNTITNIIEKSPNQPEEDDGMVRVEDPKEDELLQDDNNNNDNNNDNNSENNNNDNSGDNNNQGNNNSDNNNYGNNNTSNDNQGNNYEHSTYTIRGKAWLDKNKNGKRDDEEQTLSNIKVLLINNSNGDVALNTDSNQITTLTGEDGSYILEKIPKGRYIVVFEYDSNTYAVTSYKKKGVDEYSNSDVISKEITINGETKVRAITDIIEIKNTGKSNIDIGLIDTPKFDLSLNKQISSITVTNAKGTKTTNYNSKNFAKIDLVAKYMNNTDVIITYEFVVKNEGEVTGYVDSIVDKLPSGLEFNSKLNKGWYKDNNGNLNTTKLSESPIKPGETKTIKLTLTKKTTENTTGTFTNNAEIAKTSNIEAIQENIKENNKSSADVVISIKTGSVILYMGITLLCIVIVGSGIYVIKKKVLEKEI